MFGAMQGAMRQLRSGLCHPSQLYTCDQMAVKFCENKGTAKAQRTRRFFLFPFASFAPLRFVSFLCVLCGLCGEPLTRAAA